MSAHPDNLGHPSSSPRAHKPSKDQTFQTFSLEQAQQYAKGSETVYPPALVSAIIGDLHLPAPECADTVLVDVGCGSGRAARSLARYFTHVVGTDHSPAMIGAAEQLGGVTGSNKPIVWRALSAEDIDSLQDYIGKVDIITSASAIHWADMDRFWHAAARLLKPGGTVALWTCASFYCHPTVPNAAAVEKLLRHFYNVTIAPYNGYNTNLHFGLYEELPLPWTLASAKTRPLPFSPQNFRRKEWDRDGVPSAGPTGPYLTDPDFKGVTADELSVQLCQAGSVARWRQDEKNHGKEDCVAALVKEIRRALPAAVDRFSVGEATAVLLVKKNA